MSYFCIFFTKRIKGGIQCKGNEQMEKPEIHIVNFLDAFLDEMKSVNIDMM